MGFSAGNVRDSVDLMVGRKTVHPEFPQAGFPGRKVATTTLASRDGMSEGDVIVRDQGQNTMNPYGIAGQQGPAINIGRAARAIRGVDPPPIVQIERRVDPQAPITGLAKLMGAAAAPVHNAQEQIPGRTAPGIIKLNWFGFARSITPKDVAVPEALGRDGRGVARLAANQPGDGPRGRLNSYASDIGPGSLNEGDPPMRIPHVWNDGLNAAAGLRQYGFTQQNYSVFFPHVWLGRSGFPTRGIRSISGVRAPDGPTASRIRIPAIYVPSAVG